MGNTGVVIRLNTSSEADAKLLGAAELLSALAFDHRLLIARALQSGSRTLIELSHATGLAFKPLISSIAKLLQSGLVIMRRQNNETVYELGNPRLGEVVRLADRFVERDPC
ncbi:ArsR/SmtB family transcription factor [Martelella soudanensis]|uniref:ArsR/SmtB family transcription factor n=1 Tax=unclassified Martelella TaxID=2629616 RepID=UPI0015DFFC00|nr:MULTISPECIES: winged helix-turn-helix transcriptional regulator [unclassified Martelella]